jgi:hypothetical protein
MGLMMNKNKLSIFSYALFSVGMSFINMNSIFACSCMEPPLDENIKRTDLVIRGKLNALSVIDEALSSTNSDITMKSYSRKRYEVVIKEIYKGKLSTKTINILTPNNGGDCGYLLNDSDLNKDIIFFAMKKDNASFSEGFLPIVDKNIYWSYLCGGSSFYNKKLADNIKEITHQP